MRAGDPTVAQPVAEQGKRERCIPMVVLMSRRFLPATILICNTSLDSYSYLVVFASLLLLKFG